MSSQFAKDTNVPVVKSQGEIAGMVMRYGGSGYAFGQEQHRAIVMFQSHDVRIRFLLPLPDPADEAFTTWRPGNGTRVEPLPPQKAVAKWEQACRSRWRALALVIKAKLEAVECGITTFEEEFLAHIVTADGSTIGERLIPQLPEAVARGGESLLMLPAGRAHKA